MVTPHDKLSSFFAKLKATAKERILILDGSMGAYLQGFGLTSEDFHGDRFAGHRTPLKGDSDVLTLTRPKIIAEVHEAYLGAGADIISTNTFTGTPVSQAEYGLEAHVREMNFESTVLARAACDRAEKVDGGYRITARKVFTSAAPIGDLLMTGAVWEEAPDGPSVLHFGIPMKSPHVRVMNNWKAMGMRGTGSHDVMIEGHVVPEEAVALKRKQGEWHPLFHIISMIAFPIIYAAYLGVAEAARKKAVALAAKRRMSDHVTALIGRMDTELRAAQWAHAEMVRIAETAAPSAATTNEIMIGRSLVARHAIAAVELAMEAAGGAGFYRDNGLERLFRDIQGARFHPMQQGPQATYTGRIALGLDVSTVF